MVSLLFDARPQWLAIRNCELFQSFQLGGIIQKKLNIKEFIVTTCGQEETPSLF
jgi:hypothetical protein